MHAPVLVASGPERGGVTGWLDEAGRAHFVYGEAAGYYLTFLNWVLRDKGWTPTLQNRLKDAMGWCRRRLADEQAPPTRCYLNGHSDDWRERFHFSFDQAMLLRGLTDVACETCARSLLGHLTRFVAEDGSLAPARPLNGKRRGYDRWSLQPGPYQLKTAAAIVSASAFPIPGELLAAALKCARRWRGSAAEPSGETHPLFYCLEGLMLCGHYFRDRSFWSTAAGVYSRILCFQTADGGLPTSIPAAGTGQRSDVIAQALRAGSLLRHFGLLESSWDSRLEGLAGALDRFVLPDGAVSFRECGSGEETHRNTWCAMFACQAYHLYEQLLGGDKVSERFLEVLV